MATAWSINSYDSVMDEMERVVKSKYESRLIELEKQNWDLQQKQYNPNLIFQTQGSISCVDAWVTAGTNTVVCGSAPIAIQPLPKPKNIKSLIAYYYHR